MLPRRVVGSIDAATSGEATRGPRWLGAPGNLDRVNLLDLSLMALRGV